MSLMELLILIVIAAVVGSLGQMLAGFYLGGCLVSIIVGFVGAYIGVWLARELNLPELFVITIDDERFPIIWSIVGSAILAAIVGLLTRRPVEV
ncbi:MAG: GlsB/YeaQ/YmgE family stress response membrane protein [Chloroflexi bacterium]|nr:GlsB/YeaQ/YmgE family stress response membrane protein [Chloroflexota bacterium]